MTAGRGRTVGSPCATQTSTCSTASTGTGWRNFSKYSNPEVDRLLVQARQELDRDKKGGELYKQAENLIAEDCPSVFLMNTFSNSAVLTKVKGFDHTPFDGFGAQLAPMVAS